MESDLSDLEVAFLERKFKSFMRKKRNFSRKKNINRKEIRKEIEKKMPMYIDVINWDILEPNVLNLQRSTTERRRH